MTSSYSKSSRTFQGPILLPERLYSSHSSFTSPSRSPSSAPVTIRHVSSSPVLHNYVINDDLIKKKSPWNDVPKRKDQCLCSPATHPGSFKCSMHRNSYSNDVISYNVIKSDGGSNTRMMSLYHRLYVRRKALVNSLKRIGTVDSGLLKRGLALLVKPPARQLR
ncbi:hypothetical protein CTI12_AA166130 [Artemisia annua]|uniref:Uncharacterized protein n=1 Tax=Artemisia annua TaxID=35608 RepID=A0A2U1PCS5_ARTAN|nr:hypothetical protein CTI12_AA166130 [Artemisia annua]